MTIKCSLRNWMSGIGAGSIVMLAAVLIAREPATAAVASEPMRVRLAAARTESAPPNVDALIAEILARPLFSPSRQRPETAAPEQTAKAEREPLKLPGRLEGMAILPGVREAWFAQEGSRPLGVREGEEIDGWTVASIAAGRVVLKSADGEQIVTPAPGAAVKPVLAVNKKTGPARKSGVKRVAANGVKQQPPATMQQPQRLVVRPIPPSER